MKGCFPTATATLAASRVHENILLRTLQEHPKLRARLTFFRELDGSENEIRRVTEGSGTVDTHAQEPVDDGWANHYPKRMGKTYDAIDDRLGRFILAQKLFFVATAPSVGGHVNVSPKGYSSLRILGPKRIAYVDYPGSGIETVAHLRENGRIVVMLCAFEGPPLIVRLHGKGRVVEPDGAEFSDLLAHFEVRLPPRSVIVVDVERISDSCGYSVPLFEYKGDRDQLERWAKKKQREGKLDDYHRAKNRVSVDGLKGLASAARKE